MGCCLRRSWMRLCTSVIHVSLLQLEKVFGLLMISIEDGTAPSGTVPASKIKEYCATGDGVCELHTFAITPAHLSYGVDASAAAQFIISTTGV